MNRSQTNLARPDAARRRWRFAACRWILGVAALAILLAVAGPLSGLFSRPLYAAPQQLGSDLVQSLGVNPALLHEVGLDQKLGDQIPLDLTFRDEHGQPVALRQFFGHGPVILTLVYYQCPMLCTEVLNGVLRTMKSSKLNLGKDYTIVTVSIDPKDTPMLAMNKRDMYAGMYGRAGAAAGWHFLTGDQPQIHELAQAVGFRYAYDASSGQFAHPSGIMLLTPEGKLSRYFYGIEYPERDVRLGLVEASSETIGSPTDQILLLCFHYDATTGRYDFLVTRVMQVCGTITVLALAILITILLRREHYGLPRGSV